MHFQTTPSRMGLIIGGTLSANVITLTIKTKLSNNLHYGQ